VQIVPHNIFATERFRTWKAAIESTTVDVAEVPEEEDPEMVYVAINGRPSKVSAAFAKAHFPKHVPKAVAPRPAGEVIVHVSGTSRPADVGMPDPAWGTRDEGTQTGGDIEMISVGIGIETLALEKGDEQNDPDKTMADPENRTRSGGAASLPSPRAGRPARTGGRSSGAPFMS